MAGDNALCLSGGGYRAAIFHLGAMLRLHERGLLEDTDLFSAVSGGSNATVHRVCFRSSTHPCATTWMSVLRASSGRV